MKILITPNELMERDLWTDFCDLTGYSIYAVAEGMDGDTELRLSEKKAKRLGLI